jgi:hypothetical protein
LNTLEIILGITEGLALFLYGVTRLSFWLEKDRG